MNKIEHLLTCLIEECSEVQKEATKALRFGLDDKYKCDSHQAQKIVNEFADLLGVFEMLKDEGVVSILSKDEIDELIHKKKQRVLKYMKYAIKRGTLTV